MNGNSASKFCLAPKSLFSLKNSVINLWSFFDLKTRVFNSSSAVFISLDKLLIASLSKVRLFFKSNNSFFLVSILKKYAQYLVLNPYIL